jgi:hypothetical protein
MFDLTRHIERGLAVKGCCHVFSFRLDEHWPLGDPLDRSAQDIKVEAFAVSKVGN